MNAPDLDRERLQTICAGDADLALELIAALIEDALPLVNSASTVAEHRNAAELREAAHSLKGISGTLGAARLQEAAAALESAAKQTSGNDWSAIEQLLADIQSALNVVRALHTAWLADPESVFAVEA